MTDGELGIGGRLETKVEDDDDDDGASVAVGGMNVATTPLS
jgi:hypothetical protein